MIRFWGQKVKGKGHSMTKYVKSTVCSVNSLLFGAYCTAAVLFVCRPVFLLTGLIKKLLDELL